MRHSWMGSNSLGVTQNDARKERLIDKHCSKLQCISPQGSRLPSALVAGTALAGVLGVLCALRVSAESAATPENASPALDEIVVTASKRVSTVQDTPISISAVSGNELLARGVASLIHRYVQAIARI